jgi:hypothetical protein
MPYCKKHDQTYGVHCSECAKSPSTHHDEIVAGIIQAQIGTRNQANLIEDHMKEYFTRWPGYESKFTNLEWYHIFLDFLDKVGAFMEKQSPSTPPLTEEREKVISLIKLYKSQIPEEEYGWDEHIGDLENIIFDIENNLHPTEPAVPGERPVHPPQTEERGEVPERMPSYYANTPLVISEEIRKKAYEHNFVQSDTPIYGYEMGALNMYHKMADQLSEAHNDANVFRELYEKAVDELEALKNNPKY